MNLSKSVSKRIRVTRTGKIVRRSMGIDHFRTRKSGKNLRHKKATRGLAYLNKKILNY